MNLVVVFAGLLLVAGDPASRPRVADPDVPPSPEPPRAGCDLTVEFRPTKGKIDPVAYRSVKEWLDQAALITSAKELPAQPNGARKFCITVESENYIRMRFRDLGVVVRGSFSGPGSVRVRNRFGGIFEKRPDKPEASSHVPRSNGLPSRPSPG